MEFVKIVNIYFFFLLLVFDYFKCTVNQYHTCMQKILKTRRIAYCNYNYIILQVSSHSHTHLHMHPEAALLLAQPSSLPAYPGKLSECHP